MDAIKVILGIIFGLIMLGWIATVIVMACGPWAAVVIAAIAFTILTEINCDCIVIIVL